MSIQVDRVQVSGSASRQQAVSVAQAPAQKSEEQTVKINGDEYVIIIKEEGKVVTFTDKNGKSVNPAIIIEKMTILRQDMRTLSETERELKRLKEILRQSVFTSNEEKAVYSALASSIRKAYLKYHEQKIAGKLGEQKIIDGVIKDVELKVKSDLGLPKSKSKRARLAEMIEEGVRSGLTSVLKDEDIAKWVKSESDTNKKAAIPVKSSELSGKLFDRANYIAELILYGRDKAVTVANGIKALRDQGVGKYIGSDPDKKRFNSYDIGHSALDMIKILEENISKKQKDLQRAFLLNEEFNVVLGEEQRGKIAYERVEKIEEAAQKSVTNSDAKKILGQARSSLSSALQKPKGPQAIAPTKLDIWLDRNGIRGIADFSIGSVFSPESDLRSLRQADSAEFPVIADTSAAAALGVRIFPNGASYYLKTDTYSFYDRAGWFGYGEENSNSISSVWQIGGILSGQNLWKYDHIPSFSIGVKYRNSSLSFFENPQGNLVPPNVKREGGSFSFDINGIIEELTYRKNFYEFSWDVRNSFEFGNDNGLDFFENSATAGFRFFTNYIATMGLSFGAGPVFSEKEQLFFASKGEYIISGMDYRLNAIFDFGKRGKLSVNGDYKNYGAENPNDINLGAEYQVFPFNNGVGFNSRLSYKNFLGYLKEKENVIEESVSVLVPLSKKSGEYGFLLRGDISARQLFSGGNDYLLGLSFTYGKRRQSDLHAEILKVASGVPNAAHLAMNLNSVLEERLPLAVDMALKDPRDLDAYELAKILIEFKKGFLTLRPDYTLDLVKSFKKDIIAEAKKVDGETSSLSAGPQKAPYGYYKPKDRSEMDFVKKGDVAPVAFYVGERQIDGQPKGIIEAYEKDVLRVTPQKLDALHIIAARQSLYESGAKANLPSEASFIAEDFLNALQAVRNISSFPRFFSFDEKDLAALDLELKARTASSQTFNLAKKILDRVVNLINQGTLPDEYKGVIAKEDFEARVVAFDPKKATELPEEFVNIIMIYASRHIAASQSVPVQPQVQPANHIKKPYTKKEIIAFQNRAVGALMELEKKASFIRYMLGIINNLHPANNIADLPGFLNLSKLNQLDVDMSLNYFLSLSIAHPQDTEIQLLSKFAPRYLDKGGKKFYIKRFLDDLKKEIKRGKWGPAMEAYFKYSLFNITLNYPKDMDFLFNFTVKDLVNDLNSSVLTEDKLKTLEAYLAKKTSLQH